MAVTYEPMTIWPTQTQQRLHASPSGGWPEHWLSEKLTMAQGRRTKIKLSTFNPSLGSRSKLYLEKTNWRGSAIVRTRWDPQKNSTCKHKRSHVHQVWIELSYLQWTFPAKQLQASSQNHWQLGTAIENQVEIQSPAHAVLIVTCSSKNEKKSVSDWTNVPETRGYKNNKHNSNFSWNDSQIRSVAVVAVTSQQFKCYCLCQYMSNFLMLG